MTRRLTQQFNCRALADLTRQLLVTPVKKRVEQVRRAERLYDEIDRQRNYPFDFVNFRITGYHSEAEDALLVGQALLGDLRLLIDSLSRSMGMPRTDDEPVLTPRQVAGRFNVSVKTVDRWRKLGLRWRWAEPDAAPGGASGGGRKTLVFTEQAVAHFLSHHRDRVERAGRFSQLDDHRRSQILTQARLLAHQQEMSIYRVARQLAQQHHRAVETMRLLLEQHDRDHPHDKIFVEHTSPLTPRQKRFIARAYRMGVATTKIAAHYRRSTPTIRLVLRQQRAQTLRSQKMRYIYAPTFDRPDADEVLLRAQPPSREKIQRIAGLRSALQALPPSLGAIYDHAPLASAQQQSLLVRMNYLQYKAAAARDALDRHHPSAGAMDRIEDVLDQARSLRQHLVTANLGRVLVIARQHLPAGEAHNSLRLFDLLLIGQDALFSAIDTYDVAEGQAFEPYLDWALKRRLARYEPDTQRAHKKLTEQERIRQLTRAAEQAGVTLALSPAGEGRGGGGNFSGQIR